MMMDAWHFTEEVSFFFLEELPFTYPETCKVQYTTT